MCVTFSEILYYSFCIQSANINFYNFIEKFLFVESGSKFETNVEDQFWIAIYKKLFLLFG